LNTNSSLDHDSAMGDYASLAPGVATGGKARIGAFAAICIGAKVRHQVTVGEHTVVGAGAAVLQDLPGSVVAYGTPAKVIRQRQESDEYL
jgi:acetyltransferase-like isoleucine patch superfamily enzyme